MNHPLSSRRRPLAVLATLALGSGLALAVLDTGAANAAGAPASTLVSATGTGSVEARLELLSASAQPLIQRLGSRAAGHYLDRANQRLVVDVTDSSTAAEVRAAGAVAKLVTHSKADLDAAAARLYRNARIAGTSWAVDPVANQLVVTHDSTVTGAALQKLTAEVQQLGSRARLESQAGTLGTTIAGGDAIFAKAGRCSLGFNVVKGTTDFFLTAGHCGKAAATWFANSGLSTALGTVSQSSFPGNDFALIQYTNAEIAKNPTVGTQSIATAGTPTVGQAVSRRGSTTGIHTGTVTGLEATVTYPEGTVSGLIRTNVCAEPGDSGGPLYAGTTALGLTSGGSGDCKNGGTTFFQPVTEALTTFGVTLRPTGA